MVNVLNINDFKTKLKGGGARANLFRVTLRSPFTDQENFGDVSTFLVKAAELPGSTIEPIVLPFRGRELKIAGDKVFTNWTCTVINDSKFTIRRTLERWMSGINNHEDGQGTNENYMKNIDIMQIDREENILRKYELVDAWPSDLSPISVGFDQANTIEEFTCTFEYQYWTAYSGGITSKSDLIEDGQGFGGGINAATRPSSGSVS